MRELTVDVAIIGGGPAGLAAALEVAQRGRSCAILERNTELGGILQQCIHDGFGLIRFGSRLDVYLPEGVKPEVRPGQTMVAGETVLGHLT